jgi:hydrogenase-4 membrane subunit HyfE
MLFEMKFRIVRVAVVLWMVAIVTPALMAVILGVAYRNSHPDFGPAALIGSAVLAAMAAACGVIALVPFRIQRRRMKSGLTSILVALTFGVLFVPWFWQLTRYGAECNGGEEPALCRSNPAEHFPWG